MIRTRLCVLVGVKLDKRRARHAQHRYVAVVEMDDHAIKTIGMKRTEGTPPQSIRDQT